MTTQTDNFGFIPDSQAPRSAPVIAHTSNQFGFIPDGSSIVAPSTQQQSSGNSIIPQLNPFFKSSPTDSPIISGLKTLGNVIPSTINAGTGMLGSAIGGIEHAPEIPAAVVGAVKASGGIFPAIKNTIEGAYDTLVPEGTRDILKGNTQGAQASITNDPVGNILPYILLGREAAYKVSPEAGATFDRSVSTIGKPGADALSTVAKIPGKITGGASTLGRFGIGQATGLNPSTIAEVVNSPSDFSKSSQASITRPSVAAEIKASLDTREESLSETGQGYNGIRNATGGVPAMINVDPGFLKTTIEKATGTSVNPDGSIETSGGATIRDPKDVRALNNFYDTWQPVFDQGQMTPNEFLNMRTDLSKLSKFDREISKSGDLETSAKQIRALFNNEYRAQIPGLEDTDATYSSQISELNDLRKGILDRNGELTDAGINKIANSINKGRTVFLDQLEQIKPGITQLVRTLRAIEDIENVHGQKVGTYARATLGAGGIAASLATGNIPALATVLATTILSSPDVAVPLMRVYGDVVGLKDAVVARLRASASTVNQFPEGRGSIFPQKKIPLGVPKKNVFTGSQSGPTIHL